MALKQGLWLAPWLAPVINNSSTLNRCCKHVPDRDSCVLEIVASHPQESDIIYVKGWLKQYFSNGTHSEGIGVFHTASRPSEVPCGLGLRGKILLLPKKAQVASFAPLFLLMCEVHTSWRVRGPEKKVEIKAERHTCYHPHEFNFFFLLS